MIGRLSPSGEYRQHCTAANHPFQAKPMFHSHFSAPSGRLYSIHSFLSRHVQVLMISFMTSALSQLGINMNSENAALPKLQLLLKKKKQNSVLLADTGGQNRLNRIKIFTKLLGFSWVERSRGSSRRRHLHSRLTNRNRLEILHTESSSSPPRTPSCSATLHFCNHPLI